MSSASYDDAPYSLRAHTLTHPRNLAGAARLLGQDPAPPECCRVLELGCARGGNLIPMAEEFPGSEFLGIDYSRRQIDEGRGIVSALGLKNIRFHCEDIGRPRRITGEFDYIIAHGVYSWVEAEIRDRLLALGRRHLSSRGVFYVSYNSYPGWYPHRMLREIMRYRVRGLSDPAEKVRAARDVMEFLGQAVPREGNPYGALLRGMVQGLASQEDAYLLHDHLEEVNQPVYFWQFLDHAASHGLAYLGDAQYLLRTLDMLPPAVASWLERNCDDPMCVEQYLDFIRNESFRRALLCRGDHGRGRLMPERLGDLYFTALARQIELPGEPRHAGALGLRNQHGAVIVERHPVARAALRHLCSIAPRAATFAELLEVAGARADGQASGPPAAQEVLGKRLLQACIMGMVEAADQPPRLVTRPGPRPRASRLSRWQAGRGREVTNLRHGNVELDDFSRRVLVLLDGTRDCDTLLRELAGGPAPAEGPAQLSARLNQTLRFLARAALLQG